MDERPYEVARLEALITAINSANTSTLGEIAQAYGAIAFYLKNIADNPQEKRFQSIGVLNVNFRWKVESVKGAIDILLFAGFQHDQQTHTLVLRPNTQMSALKGIQRRIEEEISAITMRIAAIPKKPLFSKTNYPKHIQTASARFVIACADTIGRRLTMEDEMVVSGCFRGSPEDDYFAIFDGHGGTDAASFAAAHLHTEIWKRLRLKSLELNSLLASAATSPPTASAAASAAAVAAVSAADGMHPSTPLLDHSSSGSSTSTLSTSAPPTAPSTPLLDTSSTDTPATSTSTPLGPAGLPSSLIRDALYESFLEIDRKLQEQRTMCGTTAVVVLVIGRRIFCANVGDARAVLCGRTRTQAATETIAAVRLSVDHKPNNPEEAARIKAAGGVVTWTLGIPRVNGRLAVSRALGDIDLKPVVSAEPHIAEYDLSAGGSESGLPSIDSPDVLVLACDGLFDELTDSEVARMVVGRTTPEDLQQAAIELMMTALTRGSTDNISVIVVGLK